MKILYGRAKIGGNMGDELNAWLWPKFFGDILESQKFEDDCLVGIGTILSSDPTYRFYENYRRKIIFGTGVRPFDKKLRLDNSYDVRFLRGPLSAYFLGSGKFITDAAYCLGVLADFHEVNPVNVCCEKLYKYGIIPHFGSMDVLNWGSIGRELNAHIISPICEPDEIESKLREIASCDFIIAEAMHGAILADILRVPWARFVLTTFRNEGAFVSGFKWMDWMSSLKIPDIDNHTVRLTNKINNGIYKLSGKNISYNHIFKRSLENHFLETINPQSIEYNLSLDVILNETYEKLHEEIVRLRNEL